MTNFGTSAAECLNICRQLVEKDLSEKLKTKVDAEFLTENTERVQLFDNYANLMSLTDKANLSAEIFKEAPELLKIEQINEEKSNYYLRFDSLRSNCRVTHQPDFGDVFIYYESKKVINYDSLIKYLISFRSEYHFHEECCEMIYKRLFDLLDNDDKLMICTLYTRRGGIDISPVRYSKGLTNSDIEALENLSVFARCGIKQ
jgi:7-cyano-7-deazaguanine reductase